MLVLLSKPEKCHKDHLDGTNVVLHDDDQGKGRGQELHSSALLAFTPPMRT